MPYVLTHPAMIVQIEPVHQSDLNNAHIVFYWCSLLPFFGTLLQLSVDVRLLLLFRHPKCVARPVSGGEFMTLI